MNFLCEDPTRAEETQILLQAAIESANDAIIITGLALDLPGPRIEYVNPAFTRMTLYTESEAMGKHRDFYKARKPIRDFLVI